MKGVTYMRVQFKPQAECVRRDCGWGAIAGRGFTPQALRSAAQRHVAQTGHEVTVDIVDRSLYSPDGA